MSKGAFSNLNPEPGRTIANLVVVPLGTGGQVDLYTHLNTAGTLDLLADVVGYFTDSTAPSNDVGSVRADHTDAQRRHSPAGAATGGRLRAASST